MADFFQWDPSILSVNVKEMDEEHKELISKMNALHVVHAKNASKEEIMVFFMDFVKYALKHFSDEEDYMKSINYSGLENHKTIHAKLVDKVLQYREEFVKTGKLTDDFFKFLATWLRAHIRGNDMLYG